MIGWKTLDAEVVSGSNWNKINLSNGVGKITVRFTVDTYIDFSNSSTASPNTTNAMIIPANTTTTLEVPTLRYTTTGSALGGDAKTVYFVVRAVGTTVGVVRIVEH